MAALARGILLRLDLRGNITRVAEYLREIYVGMASTSWLDEAHDGGHWHFARHGQPPAAAAGRSASARETGRRSKSVQRAALAGGVIAPDGD